jgi:uncharacterized protein YjbJ (UPF0337 family)
MNWDQIERNWKQFKGNAKQHWGKLTDDHLDVIAGKRDVMAGKIQEVYGISMEEADKQLSNWQEIQKEVPGANQHMSAQNGASDAPIKR